MKTILSETMKKYTLLIFVITCAFSFGKTQTILTLEEAIESTLANNYGIRIAKNTIQIAENNTDKSVNGYLPTVSASGGINGSLGGSNQTFSTGQEAATSNAFTWGANAAVNANYTLFDKRRDLTLEQLKESLNLSNLELRQTIEGNLVQVYNAYYQLAQLSENLQILEETIEVSRERLRRAQIQLDYGQGTGLQVLNAEVDIQRDSINLINSRQRIINASRNLNVLLGSPVTTDYQVETGVIFEKNLTLGELLEEARQNNANLLVNRQNLRVNEMNLSIIDAEEKPTITAGASYSFNYSDNPKEAFITSSNSRGLAANVGVNWILFDASRKIRRQNVEVNLSNQKLQETFLLQELERDIINAWENYQNALLVLDVEQASVATNQENFERTQEQLNIGRLTSLEFRQAQLNLLNAQVSLTSAKYDAKLLEIQVLQLAGRLIE